MPCAPFVLSDLCGFLLHQFDSGASHETAFPTHRARGACLPRRSCPGLDVRRQYRAVRHESRTGRQAAGRRQDPAGRTVEPGLWCRVGRRHPAARRRQCSAEDGGAITRRQEDRVHLWRGGVQARQRDAADGRGGRQGWLRHPDPEVRPGSRSLPWRERVPRGQDPAGCFRNDGGHGRQDQVRPGRSDGRQARRLVHRQRHLRRPCDSAERHAVRSLGHAQGHQRRLTTRKGRQRRVEERPPPRARLAPNLSEMRSLPGLSTFMGNNYQPVPLPSNWTTW